MNTNTVDRAKVAYQIRETAEALGISRSRVYLEIAAGRLKIFKAGRATLITRAELEAWPARVAAAGASASQAA